MSPNRHVWMLSLVLALVPASVAYAVAARADFWDSLVERSRLRPGSEAPAGARDDNGRTPRAAEAASPKPQPKLDPPRIDRIVIEPGVASRLEGRGTPGSEVTLSVGGRSVAKVPVGSAGDWSATLERPLESGDHDISAEAHGAGGVRYGDEVRLSLPAGLSARTVFENLNHAETGSIGEEAAREDEVRRRAEELAAAASERFNEIELRPQDRYGSGSARTAQAEPAEKSAAPQPGSEPSAPGIAAPVYDWLQRAARDYQERLIPKLSTPSGGGSGVASPAGGELKEAPGSDRGERTAGREQEPAPRAAQVPVAVPPEAGGAESDAARETERKAAAKRRAEEQAEDFITERQRVEEQRKAARARAAEEARREAADAKRRDEEAKRAAADAEIEAREEKRKAEIARVLAEEEKKRAEVARMIAERKARKAAEAEARKAEEARQAEEKRRLEEERAIAARQSEADKREEARLMREAEERRMAEARERQVAEKLARAEVKAAPRRVEAPEPKLKIAESQAEAASEAEAEVRGEEPEQIVEEGSTLGDEEAVEEPSAPRVKTAHRAKVHKSSAARSKSWRKRSSAGAAHRYCRKSARRCRGGVTHTVRPGDSLWAIANRYYCTGERYETLVRANRRRIADPDRIFPRMRIVVPRRSC